MKACSLSILVLVSLQACSNHPTDPSTARATPVGAPTVAAPAPLLGASTGTATTAPPPVAAPPRHTFLLPDKPFDKETGFSPEADMAEGQAPSEAHPLGTVFVAQDYTGTDKPITVTEWDLERGEAIASTALPFRSGVCSARVIRAGDHLEMMAWAWNEDLHYARLTTDLRIERTDDIGTVAVRGPSAVASDGSQTIVVADGVMDEPSPGHYVTGLYGASYDASGNRIAKRLLLADEGASSLSGTMRDNAVVAGGKFWVLESDGSSGLRIVQLGTDLRSVRSLALPPKVYRNPADARLTLDGARLVVSVSDPHSPEEYEIPLDLSRVTRRASTVATTFPGTSACWRTVSMGPVRAGLCWCPHSTMCVAWDRVSP